MNDSVSPVLLLIRDGWGSNPDSGQNTTNAVHLARKPVEDRMRERYSSTKIVASGIDVGVPAGVMGNSEVGHHNIGAGRIVDQEIVRINKAFSEGSLTENPIWKKAVENVKRRGVSCISLALFQMRVFTVSLSISTAFCGWPKKKA